MSNEHVQYTVQCTVHLTYYMYWRPRFSARATCGYLTSMLLREIGIAVA